MEKDQLGRLAAQREILVLRHASASFEVATPGKAMAGAFGVLGVLASQGLYARAGEDMKKEFALEDPAESLSDGFLASLAGTNILPATRKLPEPIETDDIDSLKRSVPSGMVFDFKTTRWLLAYLTTDRDRYGVYYSAWGRLVSLDSSKVLWQADCEVDGQDPSASLPLEELTANGGVLLKQKGREAAEACAKNLLAQFLGNA